MQIDDSRMPPPRRGAFPFRESPEPVTGLGAALPEKSGVMGQKPASEPDGA
jgi:hypothetical protein